MLPSSSLRSYTYLPANSMKPFFVIFVNRLLPVHENFLLKFEVRFLYN